MTAVHRTPAAAALSRAVTAAVVASLAGLSALAWVVSIRQAGTMADMTLGLAQVGRTEPGMLTVGMFLAMWVVMSVAMMFPAVVPMVIAHRAVTTSRGRGPLPTLSFAGGYLLAWTVAGVAPLAALLGVQQLTADAGAPWIAAATGATLVVAGLYQFTDWKSACLRACRSPLGFVLRHDFSRGARSAARAGVLHGVVCLGCCWALMAVLLAVGLMNLAWMAALTIVFVAERCWRYGFALTRAVGAGLTVLGVAVAAFPGILPGATVAG